MTKVYLVTMHECDANGVVKEDGKTIIDEVFTNKKRTIAYVKWSNKTYWETQRKWYWTWITKSISKLDFTKY